MENLLFFQFCTTFCDFSDVSFTKVFSFIVHFYANFNRNWWNRLLTCFSLFFDKTNVQFLGMNPKRREQNQRLTHEKHAHCNCGCCFRLFVDPDCIFWHKPTHTHAQNSLSRTQKKKFLFGQLMFPLVYLLFFFSVSFWSIKTNPKSQSLFFLLFFSVHSVFFSFSIHLIFFFKHCFLFQFTHWQWVSIGKKIWFRRISISLTFCQRDTYYCVYDTRTETKLTSMVGVVWRVDQCVARFRPEFNRI